MLRGVGGRYGRVWRTESPSLDHDYNRHRGCWVGDSLSSVLRLLTNPISRCLQTRTANRWQTILSLPATARGSQSFFLSVVECSVHHIVTFYRRSNLSINVREGPSFLFFSVAPRALSILAWMSRSATRADAWQMLVGLLIRPAMLIPSPCFLFYFFLQRHNLGSDEQFFIVSVFSSLCTFFSSAAKVLSLTFRVW